MSLPAEDEAAVNALGPDGIATGTKALNVATELVKGVFPQSGPIIQNGAVQTKWGPYALPASMLQDQEVIEKLFVLGFIRLNIDLEWILILNDLNSYLHD